MPWIVMTSAAKMPSSCRGKYRNVALVEIEDIDNPPATIREQRGVLRIQHWGAHNVGKTDRCAYRRMLANAETVAAMRNIKEEGSI